MESEAEHILAISAAWAFSCKGGDFPAASLSNLLLWKRMCRSAGPAGPWLHSRVELKCWFSVFCQAGTHSPQVCNCTSKPGVVCAKSWK